MGGWPVCEELEMSHGCTRMDTDFFEIFDPCLSVANFRLRGVFVPFVLNVPPAPQGIRS